MNRQPWNKCTRNNHVFTLELLEFANQISNDEFDYIEKSLVQLPYPKYFIQHAKIKAFKIHKNNFFPIIIYHTYIIWLNNSTTNIIEINLNNLQIEIVTNFLITKYFINKNNNTHIKFDAGINAIQCLDCNKNTLGKI